MELIANIVSCVSVVQSETLRTFVPGGTITLNCKIEEFHENYFSWFRQSLGEAPTCIVTLYSGTAPVFHGDFLHEKRFTADKKGTELNLTLTDTREADSGLYYCAALDYDLVIFSKEVFLESQDQTKDSVKLKESHHSGDSVTLQCTMLSESCSRDYSVYWFRHTPGESPAGIIYTHGDTNSQCSRSSETDSPTQSCVYKLPKTNLSLSDPGTYYCAVAVCGQILFGNGSKLELTGEHPNWKIMALVSSNILCLIIIAVLLFARTKKRNISMSGGCNAEHFLPELESTVKVQTGLHTSFACSPQEMEPTDVATYYCGSYNFGELIFENGTKLILEEHTDVSPNIPVKDNEEKDGKMRVSEILVVVLAVTHVAWIFLIIWLCHFLRKKRAGERVEANSAADKMDNVNYAALTFDKKQKRTVPKTSGKSVIYGAVRHQQES
ncbi:uncharacterized protein [Hoplias malabaricus]|uniref:uncharacterized protein n=1 Tax=Hoplias malabaricus TaxID=27720 RepID=UPI0034623639